MKPKEPTLFWKRTLEEMGRTRLNATLEEAVQQTGREFVTYAVALDSFQGCRLRAWYSVPKDPQPGGKVPGGAGGARLQG